jgi:hypothetical protein
VVVTVRKRSASTASSILSVSSAIREQDRVFCRVSAGQNRPTAAPGMGERSEAPAAIQMAA